jgi:hypothetical protein
VEVSVAMQQRTAPRSDDEMTRYHCFNYTTFLQRRLARGLLQNSSQVAQTVMNKGITNTEERKTRNQLSNCFEPWRAPDR